MGASVAEVVPKIAEVRRWRKLLKHRWREQPMMAEHWRKFPKRCCRELPRPRIPEVVTEIAEQTPTVAETPEAVHL